MGQGERVTACRSSSRPPGWRPRLANHPAQLLRGTGTCPSGTSARLALTDPRHRRRCRSSRLDSNCREKIRQTRGRGTRFGYGQCPAHKGSAPAGRPAATRTKLRQLTFESPCGPSGAVLVLSDGPPVAHGCASAVARLQKNAAQVAQQLWLMRAVGDILAFRDSQGTAQEGAGGCRS